jgi:nitronate monooxygenase
MDAVNGELNEAARKFMRMFDLKYPIVQAPMDGPAASALATSVANTGALGSLPLTWLSPETAFKRVTEVKENTTGAFFGNYVLNFPTNSLDQAIAAGLKAVQFSWGLPDSALLKKLRDHSIRIGIQVVGKQNAQLAVELDPDFLVCQGIEAGGHVQANQPLMDALQDTLAVAKDIPVVASGGMTTGHHIRKYISAGAAAAVLGTRFVATEESVASLEYKNELLAASSAKDTVLTVCLNKVWPDATHRILRSNNSFKMWEAAGSPAAPPQGMRPGEHDIVAIEADGSKLERYVGIVPISSMKQCNVNALGTYAGEGVGDINDIPSTATLIPRLWNEFQDT